MLMPINLHSSWALTFATAQNISIEANVNAHQLTQFLKMGNAYAHKDLNPTQSLSNVFNVVKILVSIAQKQISVSLAI